MLELKIKTKKETVSKKIPESWKECSLGMWMRLREWDGKDYVKGFSLIMDIDYDIISRSKSKKLYRTLFDVISWTGQSVDWENLKVPEFLTINKKDIQIPPNLGAHTLGQKILVHEAMLRGDNITQALPVALAVYLDPLYHGSDFDRERSIKFEKTILELPVLEAYPAGIFFLTKLLPSQNYGISALLRLLGRSLQRGLRLRSWPTTIDLRS